MILLHSSHPHRRRRMTAFAGEQLCNSAGQSENLRSWWGIRCVIQWPPGYGVSVRVVEIEVPVVVAVGGGLFYF